MAPKVTINELILAFETRRPFIRPNEVPITIVKRAAGKRPNRGYRLTTRTDDNEIIDPADKSNSPPIIAKVIPKDAMPYNPTCVSKLVIFPGV
jgi:hypothetical protein